LNRFVDERGFVPGKPFRPREWFILPLPVIDKAIRMLLDGSILGHRYDAAAQEIVKAK
jgi:hypothetical protein